MASQIRLCSLTFMNDVDVSRSVISSLPVDSRRGRNVWLAHFFTAAMLSWVASDRVLSTDIAI